MWDAAHVEASVMPRGDSSHAGSSKSSNKQFAPNNTSEPPSSKPNLPNSQITHVLMGAIHERAIYG
jgi:hypothetical protein